MIREILFSKLHVVTAGVAGCALFAFTLVPALAAPVAADPTPTATPKVQRVDARLDKLYQAEQKVLGTEKNRLDRASDVVTKAQSRIDAMKGKGVDTSKLEAALSAFKSTVSTAQGDYDTAKKALDAHAGFDASGNVTDETQARGTVKSAGDAERQFHQTMTKAAADLRNAARDGRQGLGLKREQARIATEQKRLDQANALVGKAQDRINTLKGQGKDTSALDTALANLKTAIGQAQGFFNSAKATLDAHAGFDANGTVTDETQARTTLQTARTAMQQFHNTMKQALSGLRDALKQYAAANKPQ